MEIKEMIYLASKIASKGYNYEDLLYGDDLNGKENKEDLADKIWEHVIEYKEDGSNAFEEKYSEYKLY